MEGYFDRECLYPGTGKGIATVSYMGRSADITLKVLDAPVMLSAPDVLKTDLDKNLPFTKAAGTYPAIPPHRKQGPSLQATIGRIQGQNFPGLVPWWKI